MNSFLCILQTPSKAKQGQVEEQREARGSWCRANASASQSTLERECPYEGRQNVFFGVGDSGRRPRKSADPGVRRVGRYGGR